MKYLLVLSFILLGACSKISEKEDKELLKTALETFKPLPESILEEGDTPDRIALGRKLYLEKKLSVNGSISCNSCHLLDQFGVDNKPTSPGHEGKFGDRNSPTVYNSGLNFVQFWDGRAKDLAEQAIGPILNPVEMGMPNEEAVLKVLKSMPDYVAGFSKAFPKEKDALTYKNVGVAIAAFEKTLLTPSRFDRFLKGDLSALIFQEKRGLKTFMEVGCITCHEGVGVGGHQFQKLGLVEEYKIKDEGRFTVTKKEDDKFVFKVPSLRNVTHTAPYFHDGSLQTLDEVIPIMAKHQLGITLTKDQIEDIKVFLASLEGESGFQVKSSL